MKLIIAGSRTINVTVNEIHALLLHHRLAPTTIVSGTAHGVDKGGEIYAMYMAIPIIRFKPDWDAHGKAAGPIRNQQMADYADALLLIWDGKSKGSSNMLRIMKEAGKPVYEAVVR